MKRIASMTLRFDDGSFMDFDADAMHEGIVSAMIKVSGRVVTRDDVDVVVDAFTDGLLSAYESAH
jgi:hypothetical protein